MDDHRAKALGLTQEMYDSAMRVLEEYADSEDPAVQRLGFLLAYWTGLGKGSVAWVEQLRAQVERLEAENARLHGLVIGWEVFAARSHNPFHAHGEVEGPRKAPDV